MIVDLIVGARPNFVKAAAIVRGFEHVAERVPMPELRIVHTGQHYDASLSHSFFEQLQIPAPHVNLGAGGGTAAQQTANMMVAYESFLSADVRPDAVVVVGDVNSTMACAIVAKKACIPVAHVEAGIRSGDWTMPEEVNRIVTDSIADWYFTTSETASSNLLRSGVPSGVVFFVGNTMIDTLLRSRPSFRLPPWFQELRLVSGEFFLLTLHRPANVDNPDVLQRLLRAVSAGAQEDPVVFPVHPRTRAAIGKLSVPLPPNIFMVDPQPYLEFNAVLEASRSVITDSGGVTEEATVLGVPCITLRETTERPETVTIGTNELVGSDSGRLAQAMARVRSGLWKRGAVPPLWDGQAGVRIATQLRRLLRGDVP